MPNEQRRRLEEAGWKCCTNLFVEIHVTCDSRHTTQQHTIEAQKPEKTIRAIFENRSEEQTAWGRLYLEAKNVDPELQELAQREAG